MKNWKLNFVFISWLLIAGLSMPAFADNYPKNQKVDALNYAFRIGLSDTSDEITCEVTIDIRFVGEGVQTLRFDLINASPELQGKGMKVSGVMSEGKTLTYTHGKDELLITLPSSPAVNQRIKYTISYSGIPATGLKIAKNRYGDRSEERRVGKECA